METFVACVSAEVRAISQALGMVSRHHNVDELLEPADTGYSGYKAPRQISAVSTSFLGLGYSCCAYLPSLCFRLQVDARRSALLG